MHHIFWKGAPIFTSTMHYSSDTIHVYTVYTIWGHYQVYYTCMHAHVLYACYNLSWSNSSSIHLKLLSTGKFLFGANWQLKKNCSQQEILQLLVLYGTCTVAVVGYIPVYTHCRTKTRTTKITFEVLRHLSWKFAPKKVSCYTTVWYNALNARKVGLHNAHTVDPLITQHAQRKHTLPLVADLLVPAPIKGTFLHSTKETLHLPYKRSLWQKLGEAFHRNV